MPANDVDHATRDGQNVKVVHDRLREAILTGEMKAGSTASQVSLGQELGVGRTTVREALRMLQREGLVVGEPNRRVRVAALSGADGEQLYFMRILLEGAAVRLTVPQLTSQDIAELEGYMAQMDHFMRRHDWRGLRAPHRRFHSKLVEGVGPRVTAEIEQLFDHAERYRLAFGARSDRDWELRGNEHRAILDAVEQGHADLAARNLCAHYAQTAKQIFAVLDPAHDLPKLKAGLRMIAAGADSVLDA